MTVIRSLGETFLDEDIVDIGAESLFAWEAEVILSSNLIS